MEFKLFDQMTWSYTNPSFSLLMAPDGIVSSVVSVKGTDEDQELSLRPDRLPASRYIDVSPYAAAWQAGRSSPAGIP